MKKKSISTALLNIAFLEEGSIANPVVLLLHGWPDDATTWNGVVPRLVAEGYRVIAPWLRGFGDTVFRDASTLRTGNSAMLAVDAIAFMDAMSIEKFTIIGHDWGVNIAEAMAVGWTERVERMALLSSLPKLGGQPTSPFRHAQLQWYHWFQATKCGAAAVRADPIGFARIMWDNWSPKGWYNEQTFQNTASSWKNADWTEVTLHSYRSRWEEAEPDLSSVELEDKIKAIKTLNLPILFIQGEMDGVNPPYVGENVHEKFTGHFERVILPGVGHFPSREAPDRVAHHCLRLFKAR